MRYGILGVAQATEADGLARPADRVWHADRLVGLADRVVGPADRVVARQA
ncbi:hypothetical protein [Streptomyces sp. NPDC001508]